MWRGFISSIQFVQCYDRVCVDIAIQKGIADILDKHPEGLHVNELTQVIGIEKTKLARILRLLATKGLFKEGEYMCRSY